LFSDHDSQENESSSSRLLQRRSQSDSATEKLVSEALEDHRKYKYFILKEKKN